MKFINLKEKSLLKLFLFSIVIELLTCTNDKQNRIVNNGLKTDSPPNVRSNSGNSKNNPLDSNSNSNLNKLSMHLPTSNKNSTKTKKKEKIAKLFLTKLEKEIPFFGEWVQIRNINNDFCLKYQGEDKKIIQSLCGSHNTFLWKIQKLPNKEGIYKVVSKQNSSYVLDIHQMNLNKTLKAVTKQAKKNKNKNNLLNPPIPGPNPNSNSIPNPAPGPINSNSGENLKSPNTQFRFHNENLQNMLKSNNLDDKSVKKSNINTKKLNSKAQKKVNSARHDLNFGIKDAISTKKTSNATTQIWHIEKFSRKNFFIFKNSKTGKCLDNTGLPLAGREYQVFFCNKRNQNQAFYFYKPIENPFTNQTINIVSYSSQKCMKGVGNKKHVQQSKCDLTKHFEWRIIKNFVDDGFFFLESKLGAYVLENFNWGKKIGNPVILSKPNGSPNQLWELLRYKDKKHYMLKNRLSKKCLGNKGNINEETIFTLSECDENNPNLAFKFIKPKDNKLIKIVLPGLMDIHAKKNNMKANVNMYLSVNKINHNKNVMNLNANKNKKKNNGNVMNTKTNKKNKNKNEKINKKNGKRNHNRRNHNKRNRNLLNPKVDKNEKKMNSYDNRIVRTNNNKLNVLGINTDNQNNNNYNNGNRWNFSNKKIN